MKDSTIHAKEIPPKRYRYLWGIIFIVIIAAFFIGSMFGGMWLEFESAKAIENNKILNKKVDSLEVEKIGLQRKVLMLESSSKIDRFVVDDSQKRLKAMDAQVAKLKDELAFYRKIIEPKLDATTILVSTLRVFKNPELNFRLGLSRGLGTTGQVRGKAYLTFTGKVDGEDHSFDLKDVDERQQANLGFKFQRFQLLSTSLKWPDGFIPEAVELRLVLQGKPAKEIVKTWRWAEVVRG